MYHSRYREIILARPVFHVLENTIHSVRTKAAQSNQQYYGIQGEQIASSRLFRFRQHLVSRFQTQIEAGAHHTGKQGYRQALSQGKILHRRFLLLLTHIPGPQASGVTDHGDTCQGNANTGQQDQSGSLKQIRSTEQSREERTETGASTQGDALSQCYAPDNAYSTRKSTRRHPRACHR